jgi:DNA mismatch repair protein MutS
VDEPPVSLADGGVIRPGVDAELDELRELGRSGRQALAAIEERERQRTGIGSLKVRFNSVFGYYLEVTKANSRSVPDDYERKQTLVNAERFTTPELKEYEAKILTAQERSGEIERRIFAELRRQLLDAAGRMRETARRVAEIDMLACFAHLAALRGWMRPQVEVSGLLEFVAARHPVVERRMEESGGGRFVPNSISLEGWDGGDHRAGPGVDCADYGAEYGGQEHVSAASGAAGGDGAVRVLCAGGADAPGAGGPYLYADWGER